MKIRTQFIITMMLFCAVLLVVFTSTIIMQHELERLDEQRELAHSIERGASDLSYLSSAYLLHQEGHQRVRWNSEHSSLSTHLSRLKPEGPEQQALVENIKANLQRVKAVFADVISGLERAPHNQGAGMIPASMQVSWSRMAVQNRAVFFDTSRLSQMLQDQRDQLTHRRSALVFTLIGLFVVFLLSDYFLVYRRALRSISKLQAGTRIIGAGNLEYTLNPKHNDEIGELSHAFNRMTASLKEVTASKAAFEKEVGERKKAEEQYRALVEMSPDGIVVHADGKWVFANSAALRLFGATREEEILGLEALDLVHIDDREAAAGLILLLDQRGQATSSRAFKARRLDGQLLDVESSASRIEFQGKSAVLVVLHDITERTRAESALKESEAKYRNLFENMTEEVHFWQLVRDEEGRIKTWRLVDANPPTLKTWGRTLDEMKGKTTDEIFGPGATEHYMPVVQKIMTDGVPYVFEDDFPNLDKYFRLTSVPLGDYFITTGADITQHKQAEDKLRKFSAVLEAANVSLRDSRRAALDLMEDALTARQRAERASFELRQEVAERQRVEERIKASLREKEVLLKEIHHRVKNNLQVISSLVSLQVDELADPTLRAMFRDVRDRVRSMALVHEKLYESTDLAQVQFADYAQSLLAYLWRAHGAAAANIQLKLEMEPVPLSVENAVPCGLILNELAGNALKHAFPGGAAGEVSVALYAGPDGRVRLRVCDNGVGLPPGLDWRQSRSLGLRLVQMLAAQLNGSVDVQSGAGTEIEVTFRTSATREEEFAQTQTYGEDRP